jgi:lysophospholipase L1-like esterase
MAPPLLLAAAMLFADAAAATARSSSSRSPSPQPCTADQQCLNVLAHPPRNTASRCLACAGRGERCVTDHLPRNATCACGLEICNQTVIAPPKPGMRQLLVIGDSISLGWLQQVRGNLTQWQVTHAGDHPDMGYGSHDNNGNANWIFHCLDGWLTAHPERWDLVLINAGLHDLASDNQHIALSTYSMLLEESISVLLSRTKAKIVWLSTTPAPTNPPTPLFPQRLQSDVIAYNSAAAQFASALKLKTCDLFAAVTAVCGKNYSVCPLQKPSGIHFEAAGWKLLASTVAGCVAATFPEHDVPQLPALKSDDDSAADDSAPTRAARCPAAPAGFTLFTNHCVGGPGKTCSGELKTGSHCHTVATCVTAARAACTGACHAFAVDVGGANCEGEPAGGKLRWHTFRGGNGSVVANDDWTTYARPGGGGPPLPPTPSPSDRLALEIRCSMRQLAVEATHAKLGAHFGLRAARLAAAATRLHECPAVYEDSQHKLRGGVAAAAAASMDVATDVVVHISPNGSDSTGDGSATKPFFSPIRARDAIREARRSPTINTRAPATVILAGGIYHLGKLGTMELTAEDSNTQWTAAAGARQPVLSGAVPLEGLPWAEHSGAILVATLPPAILGSNARSFTTLFDEQTTRRLIRARHPNGDPELKSGMCFAYGGNKSLGEGCDGFIKPAATGPTKFVGRALKRITFNTSRGGKIPGDDVYKAYDMVWQAPPANLAAEGWPPAVCNSGEGGGELYHPRAVSTMLGILDWLRFTHCVGVACTLVVKT